MLPCEDRGEMPVRMAQRATFASVSRGQALDGSAPRPRAWAQPIQTTFSVADLPKKDPAPAWMADEQRCRLSPAGPLPASAAPAVSVPPPASDPARVSDTSPCNDETPDNDGVSTAFASTFSAPPRGSVNPRTGAIAQPPPSFFFFHIRPRGEGFPGFPSENQLRLAFHKVAKTHKLPLPQFLAIAEMANETAPGWSLIMGRWVDAPALKAIVRKLKDEHMKLLEYDGTDADNLYPPTAAALPSICGNLHRVGNMSFDMSHIWYGGEKNPKRVHVRFRYPNLRFITDSSYQTVACVLLRFVHNRAAVLPTDNPHVAALLDTFCSTSARLQSRAWRKLSWSKPLPRRTTKVTRRTGMPETSMCLHRTSLRSCQRQLAPRGKRRCARAQRSPTRIAPPPSAKTEATV